MASTPLLPFKCEGLSKEENLYFRDIVWNFDIQKSKIEECVDIFTRSDKNDQARSQFSQCLNIINIHLNLRKELQKKESDNFDFNDRINRAFEEICNGLKISYLPPPPPKPATFYKNIDEQPLLNKPEIDLLGGVLFVFLFLFCSFILFLFSRQKKNYSTGQGEHFEFRDSNNEENSRRFNDFFDRFQNNSDSTNRNK